MLHGRRWEKYIYDAHQPTNKSCLIFSLQECPFMLHSKVKVTLDSLSGCMYALVHASPAWLSV